MNLAFTTMIILKINFYIKAIWLQSLFDAYFTNIVVLLSS